MGYSYYNRGQWVEAESYLRPGGRRGQDEQAGVGEPRHGAGPAGQVPTKAVTPSGRSSSPAEAQANLAFVLPTQGKKAEAIDAYQRALAFEPTLKIAQTALAGLDAPPVPKQPTADAVRATAP